ncbi:MAG: amidohydrolase family protein [Pirellulales bacterium]|nr:amidohydrolase family protein [Pirellulales bacterium]
MITDVNVNLSRWPFRRTPCDELPKLIERLKRCDVAQAWAGSLDGLLHRDIGGVNARLARECAEAGANILVPFGSVNPTLPDWRDDIRRCHEDYRMPGIRLHPNYHGYKLDDPLFAELIAAAAERGLLVQLAVRMDDTRVQHPLMPVPDVELKPLAEIVAKWPKLRLVVLNSTRALAMPAAAALSKAGDVSFEIAMWEGVGGIENLIEAVSVERVLFGSHFPLFNLESAVLKLRESVLTDTQLAAITRENARRLLQAG